MTRSGICGYCLERPSVAHVQPVSFQEASQHTRRLCKEKESVLCRFCCSRIVHHPLQQAPAGVHCWGTEPLPSVKGGGSHPARPETALQARLQDRVAIPVATALPWGQPRESVSRPCTGDSELPSMKPGRI